MEFIQNNYEPMTWMLIIESIVLGIPTAFYLYRIANRTKVDLWMVASLFGAITLLMVSDYFPYSIYWVVFMAMVIIPYGKVQSDRMEYRIEIKKSLLIERNQLQYLETKENYILSEYTLNTYLSNEEIAEIRKKAARKVDKRIVSNIIVILLPSVVYILSGIARGVFYE